MPKFWVSLDEITWDLKCCPEKLQMTPKHFMALEWSKICLKQRLSTPIGVGLPSGRIPWLRFLKPSLTHNELQLDENCFNSVYKQIKHQHVAEHIELWFLFVVTKVVVAWSLHGCSLPTDQLILWPQNRLKNIVNIVGHGNEIKARPKTLGS